LPCRHAADSDHWLRHILENGATRVDHPRLKKKYLENKFEFVVGEDWVAEISGRLLSIANDIEDFAVNAAAQSASPGIKFRQVAVILVTQARQTPGVDVCFDPKDDDPAHANLVAYEIPLAEPMQDGLPPKYSAEFFKNLSERFLVFNAENLVALEQLRI
jgi:hypothetical protein